MNCEDKYSNLDWRLIDLRIGVMGWCEETCAIKPDIRECVKQMDVTPCTLGKYRGLSEREVETSCKSFNDDGQSNFHVF